MDDFVVNEFRHGEGVVGIRISAKNS